MNNVTRTPPRARTVLSTFVNPSASGATQIIAAQTGQKIRVISVVVVTTLANNVKFTSAANDISATWPLGANGGLVMSFNEHGWFETNEGEALNVNLSAATATGVHINYMVL